MRQHLSADKTVTLTTAHDIKLELDTRCQNLIGRILHRALPQAPLLGEEGDAGSPDTAALRWVVDPIDGTVNYAYGIPHAAVSIALQERRLKPSHIGSLPLLDATCNPRPASRFTRHASRITDYDTVVGVVYDPFLDELWTAIRGEPARCNGRVIQVSRRARMRDAMVAIGFAKTQANLREFLPYFGRLARRVRKLRITGSAALALTYVAMGRLDAYVERRINLWDIAAGALIIECAGGKCWTQPVPRLGKLRLVASNGLLHGKLRLPE